jgi:hypothetical protein
VDTNEPALTEISPRHRLIAYMSAWGARNTEIAKVLNLTESSVSIILNQVDVAQAVEQIQSRSWDKHLKSRLESLVPEAVQTMVQIMRDPEARASTRLDAAKGILDRSLGKPIQQIELEEKRGIRELFEALDRESAAVKTGN